MSNIVTARDIDIVTTEINTIKDQTRRVVLSAAIEIGRRLVEAKSMLNHGEWGKWLEERVDYSQSTADNLMKLYNEYGSNQESLFENFTKSQAFGNLTYTKALALLAIPAEDREKFAEEHDVESMSTRELQEAIRQRDEAKQQAQKYFDDLEDAREELWTANKRADSLNEEAQLAQKAVEEAKRKAQKAEADRENMLKHLVKLQNDLEQAQTAEAEAKEQLQEVREHPEIPAAVMEKLRREAAANAATDEVEKLKKKVQKAQLEAEKAKKEKEAAEEAAKAAENKLLLSEKQVKLSNPDVAVFKSIFDQVQTDLNRLNGAYKKVRLADSETADKLKCALTALLNELHEIVGVDADADTK